MMTKLLFRFTASASILGLSACATTTVAPPAPVVAQVPRAAAPAVTQASAHDRLFELFKASDEASLKRNPIGALSRGDLRYADRLGDFISDEYYAAEKAAAEADLAELSAIPRDSLGETDQIAYDVFEIFNSRRPARVRTRSHGTYSRAADESLLRFPHFLSDLRQRQGHGSVQDARRL